MCASKTKSKLQPELVISAVVWICSVLYSIYRFYVGVNQYFNNYHDDYSDFGPGWGFLSRKQDVADFEWQTIKFLISKLCLWIIFSLAVSELLRQLNNVQMIQLSQVFCTTAFILVEFGVFPLGLIISQPLLFYLVTKSKWRNIRVVWMCNAFVLFFLVKYKSLSVNAEFLETVQLNEREACIVVYAMFWTNLKCVSFCIDVEKPFKMLDFLSYCLYLPTAFCGPFIPIGDFKTCYENLQPLSLRLTRLFLDLCRFTFWLFFVELCLHYLYVGAIEFRPEIVEQFDSWTLYGYGYTMGQFFHLKYVVLYGVASSFAKFDQIKTPTLPICIGRVHLYSDMWKYFDAGLYTFLRRYIYIPLMGWELIQSRVLASLTCFTFVYIWHGTYDYVLVWTILNYVGITIENFGKSLSHNSRVFEALGDDWSRRVACALASPLLAMSAISNFYFFAGLEIGNVFASRIVSDSFQSNAVLFMILFACCQVSTELRRMKYQ